MTQKDYDDFVALTGTPPLVFVDCPVSDDITSWFIYYEGICLNCGRDLNKDHPESNIYPHFTGACKDTP